MIARTWKLSLSDGEMLNEVLIYDEFWVVLKNFEELMKKDMVQELMVLTELGNVW
jgi:hypothetical protein